MPALISSRTAAWLRSAMSRGTGFGSRQRRIVGGGGGAGGRGDVIPCRVKGNSENDWADGVQVDLYADGFMAGRTGEGMLYLPEVGTQTKPQPGIAVLAHKIWVHALDGGMDGIEEADPQSGGGD